MAKARTIEAVVRELCLAFPDAEEFVSHGSPNYRATKGKTFATYLVNHHGDGRIALWLPMPPGAQDMVQGLVVILVLALAGRDAVARPRRLLPPAPALPGARP